MQRLLFLPRILILSALVVWGGEFPLAAQQSRSEAAPSVPEQAGKKLFLQRCSLCHLPRLNDPTTPDPFGPKLNGVVKGTESAMRARETILKGTARMPGFQYGLQPQEIDNLLAYLKTLK
ncbi:MAG: cytochrome c [Acidobacteria bacterium]|nr:cytochrome c [Acidobacteriota bacterium]